ncbi:Uncharacterized protein FWK35_00007824 [Aphis craccivora]|uniref:Pre-C2HC domain-containing protein n=1 Tax=Aphis craccivora TaxID=307492 RepID=A0A6G0YUK0_APHCR|nr:Uncharacterized protein FWK35_00007824 [Aphis craccivora]
MNTRTLHIKPFDATTDWSDSFRITEPPWSYQLNLDILLSGPEWQCVRMRRGAGAGAVSMLHQIINTLLSTDNIAPTLSSTNLKDDPVNQHHTERDMGPPAPPIYIKNIVLGHSVKHIYNAKNKNEYPLPLFFEDILTQDNNKDILDIKSLLNTKVLIEKPHKKRRGPPQCHNCQSYGHTRNNCCHKPKCVKCGENHLTKVCSKDRQSPTKCILCTK